MKHSYIIVEKVSGRAVCEFFSEALVCRVNADKYYVYTALEYLGKLNSDIKANN